LDRYGTPTLLYIRLSGPSHPSGTVVWDRPGLLLGSIDRFSDAADTGPALGASAAAMLVVCQRAHDIWLEHAQSAGDQTHAPIPARE